MKEKKINLMVERQLNIICLFQPYKSKKLLLFPNLFSYPFFLKYFILQLGQWLAQSHTLPAPLSSEP